MTDTPITLLSTRQVAKRLGCHLSAVRAMLADGRLRGVPNPASTAARPHARIRSSDVDALVGGGS